MLLQCFQTSELSLVEFLYHPLSCDSTRHQTSDEKSLLL